MSDASLTITFAVETFNITPKGGGTEVRFTHVGLVPGYECFDSCSAAWNFYIASSLPSLIASGAG